MYRQLVGFSFYFSFLLVLLSFLACKSIPEQTNNAEKQKAFKVAVLFGLDHPILQSAIEIELERAKSELNQVEVTLFTGSNFKQNSDISLEPNNRQQKIQLRTEQAIQEIIASGYNAIVVFGDEIPNLTVALRAARKAGLIIIYCGFIPQPLINQDETLNKKRESTKEGLVHVNIVPMSMSSLLGELKLSLQGIDPPNIEKQEYFSEASRFVLVLFGSNTLTLTRELYQNLQVVLKDNADRIKKVRFLDPYNIDTGEQVLKELLKLPQRGVVLVLDPMLLFRTAMIVQRHAMSSKIIGLGWSGRINPLLASHSIIKLIDSQIPTMLYAGIYSAFIFLSGQKKGVIGEQFLLGYLGQRSISLEGSLVVSRKKTLTIAKDSPAEKRISP